MEYIGLLVLGIKSIPDFFWNLDLEIQKMMTAAAVHMLCCYVSCKQQVADRHLRIQCCCMALIRSRNLQAVTHTPKKNRD